MSAVCDLSRLTVEQVPQLWEERARIFAADTVDLGATTELDSSGIAFLVRWAKAVDARRQGARLILEHVPDRALRLIRTFRLEPLFELRS